MLTAAFPTSYISIHASAREATTRTFMTLIMQEFQSTPPRGRRPDIAIDKYYFVNFNPRLREGGDRCNAASGIQSDYFNPRLREGGDGQVPKHSRTISKFQSTPPRGRRRNVSLRTSDVLDISIHASAREATFAARNRLIDDINFNPRLREGGNLTLNQPHFEPRISIHASAREATHAKMVGDLDYSFQSTPPRGRRLMNSSTVQITHNFNPRLREGGDGV